jgi:hypothetical protein
MYTPLMLGCGLFWTITYILIIRQGILDRTYGMPLVALCANLSWEFIFSFVHPHGPMQRSVNLVWFTFDVIILIQVLRYGPREFPDLPRNVFYTAFGLTFITSFGLVLLVTYEFNDWAGAYAAFGQNLMMSALFIVMLYRRRSLRGQSISIGLCKLIGSAFSSVAFYFYVESFEQSVLLPFLYSAILVYDLLYVGLLYRQQHVEARERRDSTIAGEQVGAAAVAG